MEQEHPQNNILIDIKDLLTLLIAGNFTFTVKSLRTGHHYTYQVVRNNEYEDMVWNIFPDVGKLVMRDNRIEYDIPANRINEDSVKVFTVVFNLMKLNRPHPQMEIYRSIKCAKCGRKLTDPISLERGIGTECWKETVKLLTELDIIQKQNQNENR